MNKDCISCQTVAGTLVAPGGIVFENPAWMVVLRAHPLRSPCLPLILLKRHCEDLAELEEQESSTLGTVMQLTAQAINKVLKPAKIHFGLYAEDVKHIHMHVFPRLPAMPAGNIPNLWIGQGLEILHRLGLKKSYPDPVVAQYAAALRTAYLNMAD
jgi:diadenosine tetraphosphate (Ap4A) HIT family hydrolase